MGAFTIVESDELVKGLTPDQRLRVSELRKEYVAGSHEGLATLTAIYQVCADDLVKSIKDLDTLENERSSLQTELARALSSAQESIQLLKEALKTAPHRAAKRATNARWSRLKPVKQLAFERRRQFAHLKRSPAIDKFLPEILEACRAAGEPLTGGDPKATVERWFRKAGIK